MNCYSITIPELESITTRFKFNSLVKVGLKGNGDANGMRVSTNPDINSHGVSIVGPLPKKKNEEEGVAENAKLNLFLKGEEPVGRGWQGASGLKYEITKKCGSWLVSV
ncbi:hypothetical protein GmHk_05G013261 [Glycine max]|nr:hypothetical protein GmHk_05G013261 [Glycine max]